MRNPASPSSLGGPWHPRYALLDGLRGIAATLVVVHHIGPGHQFNLGHYAVLLFFVISGYCVTAAADSCGRHQLTAGAYMLRRLRRIYPPYFFAIVFFVITRVVKLRLGLGDQLSRDWLFWIQNATLTQWISLVLHPASWACDNHKLAVAAFWSLNYEEQFYIVVGLLSFASRWFGRFSIASGHLLLVAAAVLLNVLAPSTSTGLFVEYWVPFGTGGLLFLCLCGGLSRRARMGVDLLLGALPVAGLILFFLVPSGDGVRSRNAFLEWAVAGGFALVLRLARPISDSVAQQVWYRPFAALGLVSYSLYLVHQFNLRLAEGVAHRLLPNAPASLSLVVQVVVLLGIAALFWRLFERPFLNRALSESPAAAWTPRAAENTGASRRA